MIDLSLLPLPLEEGDRFVVRESFARLTGEVAGIGGVLWNQASSSSMEGIIYVEAELAVE